MADDRTYIRVHDGLDEHAKIVGLSDAAFRLLISSWTFCSRNLNDGRIATAAWRKRGTPKARRELVDAGLAEEHDGYVEMHDYLMHQRSAAEVAAYKAKKRSAGAKGNHTKHHVEKGRTDPECEFCQSPEGSQKGSQVRPQTARKAVASTEAEAENYTTEIKGGSHVSSGPTERPPLYSDRCTRHGNDAEPPPCGQCADVRKANAARPPLTLVPSEVRRCLVHDQTFTNVCRGCRADEIAADRNGETA